MGRHADAGTTTLLTVHELHSWARDVWPSCRPDQHARTPSVVRTPGPGRGSQWTGRRCRCRIGPVNARTSIHSKVATNANVTRTDRIIPRLPSVGSVRASLPGIAGGQSRLHLGWACAPHLGRMSHQGRGDRLSSGVSPRGPLTSSVRETIRLIGGAHRERASEGHRASRFRHRCLSPQHGPRRWARRPQHPGHNQEQDRAGGVKRSAGRSLPPDA